MVWRYTSPPVPGYTMTICPCWWSRGAAVPLGRYVAVTWYTFPVIAHGVAGLPNRAGASGVIVSRTEESPDSGPMAPWPMARLAWLSPVLNTFASDPVCGSRSRVNRPSSGGLFAEASAGGGLTHR